jgi:hypothetical protein
MAGVTGQQRMLPSPQHLIQLSHLSVVRVAYIRFCNCFLDYDYVLHIVNFAILCTDKLQILARLRVFRDLYLFTDRWNLSLGNRKKPHGATSEESGGG